MNIDAQTIEWAFKAILSFLFGFGVKILSDLKSEIIQLNIKMAVVVEQVSSHDKRISKLEEE